MGKEARAKAAIKAKAEETQLMGRIMFRVEGSMWNAYYGLPDSMEGAIYLGGIQMAFVEERQHKEAFMSIMRAGISKLIPGVASWKTQAAPEHEKTKE